jgi:RepB DNA-primase from phage plasmid
MTNSGVAFMVTNAMKAALRSHGFVDADIENMKPGEAHKILLTPDARAVRGFVEAFVALATSSLGGHPAPGCLQTCRKHPSDDHLVPTRYRFDSPDLVDRMTRDALVDSEAGHNVYVEPRFVKFGLKGKARGELKDTACVFALVVDSDIDKGRGWDPPVGMRPTLTVQTSPGNAQFWFFFDHALSPTRAQRLGEGLRRITAGDFDTGNPTQPYRIAGTVNYPDKVKVARGRVVTPTFFVGAGAVA